MDHREIIKLWPSARELAEDLGKNYETVRKWRFRNSIPADYWMPIIEAGKKRRLRVALEEFVVRRAAA